MGHSLETKEPEMKAESNYGLRRVILQCVLRTGAEKSIKQMFFHQEQFTTAYITEKDAERIKRYHEPLSNLRETHVRNFQNPLRKYFKEAKLNTIQQSLNHISGSTAFLQ